MVFLQLHYFPCVQGPLKLKYYWIQIPASWMNFVAVSLKPHGRAQSLTEYPGYYGLKLNLISLWKKSLMEWVVEEHVWKEGGVDTENAQVWETGSWRQFNVGQLGSVSCLPPTNPPPLRGPLIYAWTPNAPVSNAILMVILAQWWVSLYHRSVRLDCGRCPLFLPCMWQKRLSQN